jgi:hypothetical protein
LEFRFAQSKLASTPTAQRAKDVCENNYNNNGRRYQIKRPSLPPQRHQELAENMVDKRQ